MKKIIIALMLSAGLQQTFAQEVAFFQIDNTNHVSLNGYPIGTKLEYFSTPQGGKQMGYQPISNSLPTMATFAQNATPAFVLNRKSTDNPLGTNLVYFLDKKEFIAKEINFESKNNQAQISWQAQIDDGQDISFAILKSKKNQAYTVVKIIQGGGQGIQAYSFAEPLENDVCYKLQILKNGTTLRYASGIYSAKVGFATCYPTVSNSQITIEILQNQEATPYTIHSLNGTVVQQGIVSGGKNTVPISTLTNGMYMVHIGSKASFKICKQ